MRVYVLALLFISATARGAVNCQDLMKSDAIGQLFSKTLIPTLVWIPADGRDLRATLSPDGSKMLIDNRDHHAIYDNRTGRMMQFSNRGLGWTQFIGDTGLIAQTQLGRRESMAIMDPDQGKVWQIPGRSANSVLGRKDLSHIMVIADEFGRSRIDTIDLKGQVTRSTVLQYHVTAAMLHPTLDFLALEVDASRSRVLVVKASDPSVIVSEYQLPSRIDIQQFEWARDKAEFFTADHFRGKALRIDVATGTFNEVDGAELGAKYLANGELLKVGTGANGARQMSRQNENLYLSIGETKTVSIDPQVLNRFDMSYSLSEVVELQNGRLLALQIGEAIVLVDRENPERQKRLNAHDQHQRIVGRVSDTTLRTLGPDGSIFDFTLQ